MIWLVWRQHRKQALFALVGLAALAAFVVPTGMQMHGAFERAGLDDCLRATARVEFIQGIPDQAPDPVRACQELADQFAGRYGSLGAGGVLLWFLPLLAGMFWGAPLVAREVEHGTHRLVWTQGVSRLRWALAKFGLVGAGVVLAAACCALLVTWWRTPLARPRFLAPLRRTFPVLGNMVPTQLAGDWLLRAGVYSADGTRLRGGVFGGFSQAVCGPPPTTVAGGPPTTVNQCMAEFGTGAYNLELFHPAERFWLFQGIETALFVVLAVLLLLASVHWVRRRIS